MESNEMNWKKKLYKHILVAIVLLVCKGSEKKIGKKEKSEAVNESERRRKNERAEIELTKKYKTFQSIKIGICFWNPFHS